MCECRLILTRFQRYYVIICNEKDKKIKDTYAKIFCSILSSSLYIQRCSKLCTYYLCVNFKIFLSSNPFTLYFFIQLTSSNKLCNIILFKLLVNLLDVQIFCKYFLNWFSFSFVSKITSNVVSIFHFI